MLVVRDRLRTIKGMLLSCVRATRLGEKGRMSRCKNMNGRSCTSTYSEKFKVPSHMRMNSISTTALQYYSIRVIRVIDDFQRGMAA